MLLHECKWGNLGTRLWASITPEEMLNLLFNDSVILGAMALISLRLRTAHLRQKQSSFIDPLLRLCSAGRMGGFPQENNSIDTGQVDIGKRVAQSVPPGVFWRSYLNMDEPRFLKFNISVQRNALVGVYGRKGLAPSHTQVRNLFSETHKNTLPPSV